MKKSIWRGAQLVPLGVSTVYWNTRSSSITITLSINFKSILNLFNISHYINHTKQTIIQCWKPSGSNNSLCSDDKFCLISLWIKISLNSNCGFFFLAQSTFKWKYVFCKEAECFGILDLGLRYILWSYLFSTRSFGAFWYLSENACPQPLHFLIIPAINVRWNDWICDILIHNKIKQNWSPVHKLLLDSLGIQHWIMVCLIWLM
jgi:hypothetical protein